MHLQCERYVGQKHRHRRKHAACKKGWVTQSK